MSTWHQERAGKPLPVLTHPTLWTSYNPRGHLSVMRHESYEACMAYCKKTGDVPLAPAPQDTRSKP
jgi:hypothetical protein